MIRPIVTTLREIWFVKRKMFHVYLDAADDDCLSSCFSTSMVFKNRFFSTTICVQINRHKSQGHWSELIVAHALTVLRLEKKINNENRSTSEIEYQFAYRSKPSHILLKIAAGVANHAKLTTSSHIFFFRTVQVKFV